MADSPGWDGGSTVNPGTPAPDKSMKGLAMAEGETVDTRGDERHDLIAADTNHDGKPDLWATDTDGDGKADLFQFDTDGDGQVDVTMVDRDQDGTPDQIVDGDGGHAPEI
jgi:hypothetical protein